MTGLLVAIAGLVCGYAVHRLLRWAIRRDDLTMAIQEATLDGRTLLLFDRIERREYHLLPKSRRAG